MSEDKPKKFNTKYLTIALGVGLSLLSVALVLNQIPVIIQINFAFFYIFGFFYYILLAFMFITGILISIKPLFKRVNENKKPRKWTLEIIGLSIFIIATILLCGVIGPNEIIPLSKSASTYHEFYVPYLTNYKATTPVNIFILSGGQTIGGLFGTLLASLFAFGSVSYVGPVLFLVLFFVLSLILIFNVPIRKLIRHIRYLISEHKRKKLEYEEIASLDVEEVKAMNDRAKEPSGHAPVNIQTEPEVTAPIINHDTGSGMSKPRINFGDEQERIVDQTPLISREEVVIFEEEIPTHEEIEEVIEEIEEEVPLLTVKEKEEPKVVTPKIEPPKVSEKPKTTPPPTPKKKNYIYPGLDLLDDPEPDVNYQINHDLATRRVAELTTIFEDLGVGAHPVSFCIGPAVTRFDIAYDAKVKATAVRSIVNDISIRLGGVSARFEELVIGKPTSGLEVPNAKTSPVYFKEVMKDLIASNGDRMMIPFGKSIEGENVFGPLDLFPHMLVAGTTGSGKSIFVHALIMTLIMRNSPETLRLMLIDPKRVEMSKYREMGHLICPIITDYSEAKVALERLVEEMEDRYTLFEQNEVNSITSYNQNVAGPGKPKLPYIVVVIEEFADLMDATNAEVAPPVKRLGQKSRAAGIHMIIAVQRPSAKVLPGDIKTNIKTRVALTTASGIDSQVVLDRVGAEQLLGKGDMLVDCTEISRSGVVRLQGCFVKEKEMARVAGFIRDQGPPDYDPKFLNLKPEEQEIVSYGSSILEPRNQLDDEKYLMIRDAVFQRDYASASYIQTTFGGGFNTATRYYNRLRDEGIVEAKPSVPARGSKVLIHSIEELERKMNRDKNGPYESEEDESE